MLTEAEPEYDVETFGELFWRICSKEGALMIFALSLPSVGMVVGSVITLASAFVWPGILDGYFFQTIDHVARHDEGLPFSADVMFSTEIFGQVVRGGVFMAIALGPAVIAAAYVPDEPAFVLLSLLAGMCLAPAALIACVVTRSSWSLLWPPTWLGVIMRAQLNYVRFLGQLLVSVVVWFVLGWFFTWLMVPVSPLAWFVMPLFHTAFALWVAALFGRHFQIAAPAYGTEF